jgi:hypothetical protein
MPDPVTVTISVLSLAIASLTAWLTLFRRGTVRMTHPTLIFFGRELSRIPGEPALPKIFLRTLLFSTSKRGRVIESMHVAVSGNEAHQNFSLWAYGERDQLVPGSGLFVGETGVAVNHHFLAPEDASGFVFASGEYNLDVFTHLLGERNPLRLFSQTLVISPEIATATWEQDGGVLFQWGPDSGRYRAQMHRQPQLPTPDFIGKLGLRPGKV